MKLVFLIDQVGTVKIKKNLKFGAFKREFPLNELARLSLERVQ